MQQYCVAGWLEQMTWNAHCPIQSSLKTKGADLLPAPQDSLSLKCWAIDFALRKSEPHPPLQTWILSGWPLQSLQAPEFYPDWSPS
jgi:hypothetical protein